MALWTVGPGKAELRTEQLPPCGDDDVEVRTLWSGVSRGTEALVARGGVPRSEYQRMRAPFQEGDFPFPVKYGYLSVGTVESGPGPHGPVFALHPHQSRFVVPQSAVTPIPAAVPLRRAVLAGAVETAVNVLWDARPQVGDRIFVIGAGMIGGAIAAVARGIPGAEVTLIDVDEGRAAVAASLGVGFAVADEARPAAAGADVVIEASGRVAGLQLALTLAPTDGEVIVASWFGDQAEPLDLGADFHSRRLAIRASQVGAVAASRRAHRSTGERLALALRLLEDPGFDALLGGTSTWRRLPDVVAALADGTADVLCHTIDWSDA
ncbi:dehydrogenase [Microbacterium mangrovi]|uniref:Dehydrogenase n=1 Tax=Microbacterium mangrovi TaxID=1348253 RepID=A0A0B2A1N2_9MICO|nr:dehydrogenase [Microbacterium mangrovi]